MDILREWVAETSVADVTEKLVAAEVPVGPVQTVPQMARDPHLKAREMMVEVPTEDGNGTIMAPGLTIKFSKTMGTVEKVPAAGEHTKEILGGLLNLNDEKLEDLRVGRGDIDSFSLGGDSSRGGNREQVLSRHDLPPHPSRESR